MILYIISFVYSLKISVYFFVPGGDYGRSSTEGIHFALLEWLLLSECSIIINTYGSSFAVEAAQRYLRPIVVITYLGRRVCFLFFSLIRVSLCRESGVVERYFIAILASICAAICR